MDISTVVFALLAGALSTLSPCVLPLLPAIMAGAASQDRYGPVALAGGVALSFATISLFVATIGYGLGLNGDVFRVVGGALMIGIGVVLLVPAAQTRWAIVSGPIQTWTEARFGGLSTTGLRGQLSLGLLLGAVWAPCVGPTLGAASLMASRGENLGVVTAVTIVFALGAAAPLLLLGLLSRKAWVAWSGRFAKIGSTGKLAVGTILFVVGLLAVTGLDRAVQTFLVSISPAWLTALITSI